MVKSQSRNGLTSLYFGKRKSSLGPSNNNNTLSPNPLLYIFQRGVGPWHLLLGLWHTSGSSVTTMVSNISALLAVSVF